ncbi:hypothetical protein ABZ154_09040 [Streptomyces sp. NPDC006261]|uniref:hypothetical protein n=1 Tax=Streptomyces sp. NPDC006261 TaxID=3156739 RepID=UPI0033A163CA
MKLRKVAGVALLSLLPIGWIALAIDSVGVLGTLAISGIVVLIFAIIFTSLWLIEGDR